MAGNGTGVGRIASIGSALALGFLGGALLAPGYAQDRGLGPTGRSLGPRAPATAPRGAPSTSSSPEAPGPGRPSATQRAALRTLWGGPALPPPGLAFLGEGSAARASAHQARADALDALAVRSAREVVELTPRAAEPLVCLAANAARRALLLALDAGRDRADTADALWEDARAFATDLDARPDEAAALAARRAAPLLRVDGPSASARLRDLAADAEATVLPALEAAGCAPTASTSPPDPPEPRVHLSSAARRSVSGRVAFFVRADAGATVVWVDGVPEGLTEADGWGVVTAPPRSVTLCAAPAVADRCDPEHRIVPGMGDAYDLRGARAVSAAEAAPGSLPPAL